MENKETENKQTEKKSKLSKQNKKVIGVAISVVIIAGVCALIIFFWMDATYFSTQNAKVTATMINIVPLSAGKLTRWTVKENDTVTENEIIGRVENSSYLRSPVNGILIQSNVTLNQLVSPATIAGVVADTSDTYILANIDETSIMKVREGQTVYVDMDAFPFHTFEGYVSEIDMLTQDALGGTLNFTTSGTFVKITKLIPVKIRLKENVDLAQVLGTNATVRVKLR